MDKVNNIMKDFLMQKPNLKILQIVDYDNEQYIIAACENINKIPMKPYYSMDKRTGEVDDFDGMIEPEKFFSACRNREIYSIRK